MHSPSHALRVQAPDGQLEGLATPQVHAAAEAQPPLPQAAAAVVQDETEAGEPIPAFSSAPMSQHPIFGSFPNIGITSQQPPASEAGGPNGMDSDQTLGYLSDMLQVSLGGPHSGKAPSQ